jgi:hypothetical protein
LWAIYRASWRLSTTSWTTRTVGEITKAIEEHGKYLFKNQLLEKQQYFQENSRMSFVLVGVIDVGQEFNLVPEMLLLPRVGRNIGIVDKQAYSTTILPSDKDQYW